MSDRLEEIKQRTQWRPPEDDDRSWLITEVERLNGVLDTKQDAVVLLRGALSDVQEQRAALIAEVERLRLLADSVEVETWCVNCAHSQAKQQIAEDALRAIVEAAWPESRSRTREEVFALMKDLEIARAEALRVLGQQAPQETP